MEYRETYDEWVEEVGIIPDSESREAWERQQEKIDSLMGGAIDESSRWCWYLVIDDAGNVDESFNSFEGATDWKIKNGGTVIKVKEVKG